MIDTKHLKRKIIERLKVRESNIGYVDTMESEIQLLYKFISLQDSVIDNLIELESLIQLLQVRARSDLHRKLSEEV